MQSRQEDFAIVCAIDDDSPSEVVVLALRDLFKNAATDYWEFLNPCTFLAFFRCSLQGDERAHELMRTLRNLQRKIQFSQSSRADSQEDH